MKITLMVFGLMLASSQAMAAKYAVNCFDGNGRGAAKFKAQDIADVSGMSTSHLFFTVSYLDGRILYVPKANCIVEEFKSHQTPILSTL